MKIRIAAAPDLNVVLDLYRHLHAADAPLPPQPRLEETWRKILEGQQPTIFLVEVDGEAVASCALAVILNLTRGARPYGMIENVVTHAAHRKRGYGSAVMKHALSHAWNQDCYKVMLLTGSKREETLSFYEKVGFRRGVKTGFVAVAPE